MKVRLAVAVFCVFGAIGFGQSDADLLAKYGSEVKANPKKSLTRFRIGEIYFHRGNFQSAALSFRDALNGDMRPAWVEVWSHLYIGEVFDMTGQRDRALNEYLLALRTQDDTWGALEEAAICLNTPYSIAKAGK